MFVDGRLAHNYKLFVLQAAISLGIHNLKMFKNYLTCLILDKIKSAFHHQTSMNIFQKRFSIGDLFPTHSDRYWFNLSLFDRLTELNKCNAYTADLCLAEEMYFLVSYLKF